MLIFGELVSSNNFLLFLSRYFNILTGSIGLGTYHQGLPIRNAIDFVWGTDSGLRTLPILLYLVPLQKIYQANWDYNYLIIVFLMPFISFLLALRLYKKIDLPILFGSIFYGGNIWIINRLFTGFWQLNLVYSFLPFLIIIPLIIVNQKIIFIKRLFFLASLYSILSSIVFTAQPHFLIMIVVFATIHLASLLISKKYELILRLLKLYCISVLLFLLLNAYIIIPSILYPESIFTAPSQYFSLAAVLFNGQGSQLINILRLSPAPINTTVSLTVIEYIQFIPLALVVLTFVLNKKRKWMYIYSLITFIFLAKGLNEPGKDISKWLYENIFFLHFFRDPSRFLGGVALFSALIIADLSIHKKVFKKYIVLSGASMALVIYLTNLKTFEQKSVLNKTHIPTAYLSIQEYLSNSVIDKNSRLLNIPNSQGINGYPMYNNPSPISSNTIFEMVVPLSIASADSSNYPDSYSSQTSSYLYNKFTQTYDSNYLRPLGVKYVLVDNSISKPQAEMDIATSSANFLVRDTNHYQLIFKKPPLNIFKVVDNFPIVTSHKPIFAIGNLETIAKINASGSGRPVLLLNQSPNSQKINSTHINFNKEELYIDVENPKLVLTAERLANKFSVDILKAGWDYDKVFSNYEPYKMKYIQKTGELFTSGRSVASQVSGFMRVPQELKPGRYKILIKALSADSPSSITLDIDGKQLKSTIDTKEKLLWRDLGSMNLINSSKVITITKTDPSLTIIDYLLIVPEDVYRKEYINTSFLLQEMKPTEDINAFTPKSATFTIATDKIKSDQKTKYLTYRFSYGDHWKSNIDSEKFISDGYGMTFINKDGKINEINYFPNFVYHISLAISILALVTGVSYMGIYKIKKWN